MRIVLLLILLGFPALDIYLTVQFAAWTHVPVWFWLAAGEQSLLRGLLDSGRKVLAGVLFILPGVVTDIAALALLALPLNLTSRLQTQTNSGPKVFQGEYRRLD